jgi:2-polyprenyl-6-methoxyphenol hydroxylase-like FAD-dependent oxidoreductase
VSAAGRSSYDAVIVGARCAGSPLAARLAERGWSVLFVDREPPPADTISTHYLFPNTLACLRELGALARIEARHRLNPLHYAVRVLGEEVTGPFTPVAGFDRMCRLRARSGSCSPTGAACPRATASGSRFSHRRR